MGNKIPDPAYLQRGQLHLYDAVWEAMNWHCPLNVIAMDMEGNPLTDAEIEENLRGEYNFTAVRFGNHLLDRYNHLVYDSRFKRAYFRWNSRTAEEIAKSRKTSLRGGVQSGEES